MEKSIRRKFENSRSTNALRCASGAGQQSGPWGGCGRGFAPPAGGYGGPPPEKIENLHALRCILVHFQDQKVIF